MRKLRADVEANPSQWGDYLQEPDDYREWLHDLGLTVEHAEESERLTIRIADVEDYLRYKLAWTYRWEEVRAMDSQTALHPAELTWDAEPPARPEADGNYPLPVPGATPFV